MPIGRFLYCWYWYSPTIQHPVLLPCLFFKLKLIYDRQSVGQSVLVLGTHLGPVTNFFFLLEISLKRLRLCYFVPPSLTWGRVCNLLVQLLLGLARAVTFVSKSRKTHGHILLSHLRLPQPGGPGPYIYIRQEEGGPVIPPGIGFHAFSRSHIATDSQSASQAPIWDPRPTLLSPWNFLQTVAGL
jgi:hypothetical protein